MTKRVITTTEHYDLLADSDAGKDDPSFMKEYMARWDGPLWDMLGEIKGKEVLDIGIGGGRNALEAFRRGCSKLVGIDVSPRTIAKANENLSRFKNTELVVADICDFLREDTFDLAYSVLTFEHVDNKPRALANVITSLRQGGHFVLSVNLTRYESEGEDGWLDFGPHKVKLHLAAPAQHVSWLKQLGCDVSSPLIVTDTFILPNGTKSSTFGEPVAALIQATKK